MTISDRSRGSGPAQQRGDDGGGVLVALTADASLVTRIRSAADAATVQVYRDLESIDEAPEHVEALVGVRSPFDPRPWPRLRWVHAAAAGVDKLVTAEMAASGATLTSSAGNGGVPLAEHALMLMLMLDRDAPRWMRAQRDRRWDRYRHGELAGRSVVIVGMGAAGQALAAMAAACQMRVIAITRTGGREIPGVERNVRANQLAIEAATADFLVVAAPSTTATQGLVGTTILDALPSHAHVVCVSRGGIVDEQALVARLQDGRLAGAGLDAFETEPLPADSPLWAMPNVVVTPHNGATTEATTRRGELILIDNIERFVTGRPLRNVVDLAAGY
ncbi:D-2-hydroxyacid dehydrogenase [Saccharomonospora sp. NPDC046836]|uniref:D-2-hydroxyacid dehydrogenase n=1 Tax=Saccharomonospora sp. NPDC046836 TaxID=3156921 RepID=UPI0033FB986C